MLHVHFAHNICRTSILLWVFNIIVSLLYAICIPIYCVHYNTPLLDIIIGVNAWLYSSCSITFILKFVYIAIYCI